MVDMKKVGVPFCFLFGGVIHYLNLTRGKKEEKEEEKQLKPFQKEVISLDNLWDGFELCHFVHHLLQGTLDCLAEVNCCIVFPFAFVLEVMKTYKSNGELEFLELSILVLVLFLLVAVSATA